jgi:hypothetical protein
MMRLAAVDDRQRHVHDELMKRFTAEGRLIEAGWRSMLLLVLPPDAPAVQVSEMRKAFFMGAQHLYAALMCIMDADAEPTDEDMKKIELIHNELEAFRMEVTNVHAPGKA